jgi:arylsulfatase A-like enzyme
MTHNPLHAGEQFKGKSANGIYGDAVEEIDWSTGQILDFLRANNLAENTMVIFSSDNGAARPYGGINLPLSGWKGSTMEGGMRVPGIFWWPEKLNPHKVENAIATTMDLLPTIARIVDAPIPTDRVLDGHDIFDLMTGESVVSPYEVFYYYQLEQLQAVRKGPWKLHLPLDSTYGNFHQAKIIEGRPMALYNLEDDIAEHKDVSSRHAEIVADLLKEAAKAREELGDFGIHGNGIRHAGMVQNPTARLMK